MLRIIRIPLRPSPLGQSRTPRLSAPARRRESRLLPFLPGGMRLPVVGILSLTMCLRTRRRLYSVALALWSARSVSFFFYIFSILYLLLMGGVDMQETQIRSGELVMLRTTAGHAVTNVRPSSFILIELKTHQSIFLLSRLLKRRRSGRVGGLSPIGGVYWRMPEDVYA